MRYWRRARRCDKSSRARDQKSTRSKSWTVEHEICWAVEHEIARLGTCKVGYMQGRVRAETVGYAQKQLWSSRMVSSFNDIPLAEAPNMRLRSRARDLKATKAQ